MGRGRRNGKGSSGAAEAAGASQADGAGRRVTVVDDPSALRSLRAELGGDVMSTQRPIYVAGFIDSYGNGGFEWDWDEARITNCLSVWQAHGCLVSPLRQLTFAQLNPEDERVEAITDALDAWPELWEPREDGRTWARIPLSANPGSHKARYRFIRQRPSALAT